MKEENNVFVVNQPAKSILSIICVGKNQFPLENEIHDRLYELSKISDLFFIFQGEFPGINLDKFCNLYSGCGWMISKTSLVKSFLTAGEYDINIFKNHTGYLVFNDIHSIPTLTDDGVNKIMTVNMEGQIAGPILKMTRLTSAEFFDIYSQQNSITLLGKTKNPSDKKYSIWRGTSDIAFMRPSLLQKFLALSEEYKDSFSWSDIRYFIASAVKRLGLEHIDSDILNVNFKSNEESTKRKKS